jgi:hypothetical protein
MAGSQGFKKHGAQSSPDLRLSAAQSTANAPSTGDTAHRRFSASRKQSFRSLGISHPRDSDRKGAIPVRNPYSPMAFRALLIS